jgi:hypothetical protein
LTEREGQRRRDRRENEHRKRIGEAGRGHSIVKKAEKDKNRGVLIHQFANFDRCGLEGSDDRAKAVSQAL